MFRQLVDTPRRTSITLMVLALVLGAGGLLLMWLSGHWVLSLPSGLAWWTQERVNGLGLALLLAAAAVLLLGCLTAFPAALVPPSLRPAEMTLTANDYIAAQNDARSTLVNALAGLLLLTTAFFTWRQLVISQEAQVTERYTRAVELLGNADLAVRVGAVHSLGRLAVDSPKDDRSVYTLLTAYIRSRSPRDLPEPARAEEPEAWTAWRQRVRCERGHPGPGSLLKCAPDIQAALGVLAARPDVLSDGRELIPVLVDTHLPGAACGHAKLARADLRGALLKDLDCRTLDRPYANFEKADLRRAVLNRAELGRANLRGAQLQEADLSGAKLGNADLQGAKLQGAIYDSDTVFPAAFDPVAHGLREASPATTEVPANTSG